MEREGGGFKTRKAGPSSEASVADNATILNFYTSITDTCKNCAMGAIIRPL